MSSRPIILTYIGPSPTSTVSLADAIDQQTVVPGGQSIYAAPNSILRYTSPHSDWVPWGSARQTFNATFGGSDGSLGRFTLGGPDGPQGSGFAACPVTAEGPYLVCADIENVSEDNLPGGSEDECLLFTALTVPYTGEPVWQYSDYGQTQVA
ncbi:MAG: hypothetical protein Q9216_000407 [Gyalolechia sp. 2 TL-2023]